MALPVARESTYIVVWEFQVKAECEAEFVAAYGPDGEWARLFRRSPEFLGIELLGSVGNSSRHQDNCGGGDHRTERIDSHA